MSKWSCPKCGASIVVENESASSVVCAYCKTAHPISAFVEPEVVAARRLDESLSQKLEQHAASQRGVLLRVGLGLGALVVVAIVVVVATRPAAPRAPTSPTTTQAPPRTPEPPPLATPPRVEPPRPVAPELPRPQVTFGGEGTGEGRFDRASHIALDREGNVYVADRTNRVQVFDATGRLLRTLSATTSRRSTNALTADITQILGLAVDAGGKVYVSIGYDLLRLDGATGRVERRVNGRLGQTCFRDVSLDPRGDAYVSSACTDTDRYAVVRVAPSGREVQRVAEPNEYEQSSTGRVAVDGAGRWYVPYGYSYEVRVLERDGSVHTRIGRRGDGPGEFSSTALGPVALDVEGRVYVREASKIAVFASDGRPLGTFDPSAAGHLLDFALGADGSIWVLTGDGHVARFAPFSPDAPRPQ